MNQPHFLCMFSGFDPGFRLEKFAQKSLKEFSSSLHPKRSFDYCFSLEKTQYGFHCKLSAYAPIRFVSVETASTSPREAVLKSLTKLGDRLGVSEPSPRWFESRIWMQPLGVSRQTLMA